MNTLYYYDLIRLLSSIPPDALSDLLPIQELKKHCNKIEIRKATGLAKHHGHESLIKIHQATNSCIEMLQGYDFGEHSISRIEIAKDIEFDSASEAVAAREHFKNSASKSYARFGSNFTYANEWHHVPGEIKSETIYLGKKKGKKSAFYVAIYVPDEKKISEKQVLHTEFVLLNKSNIYSKLKIKSFYDLGKAKDYYLQLEGKFLRKNTLNHKKVNKLLKLGDIADVSFDGVEDFREFVEKQTTYVFRKEMSYQLNKSHLKRNRKYRGKEKNA